MYRHFKTAEFDCPCCGQNNMVREVIKQLDHARECAGIPFRITSGYRCREHNADVQGVPGSAHTLGLAADILAEDATTRWRIVSALLHAGFVRIGVSDKFIHADADGDKPAPALWTY